MSKLTFPFSYQPTSWLRPLRKEKGKDELTGEVVFLQMYITCSPVLLVAGPKER